VNRRIRGGFGFGGKAPSIFMIKLEVV